MSSETTAWVSRPIPLINLHSMTCGDKKVTQKVVDSLIDRIKHGTIRIEYGHPDVSSMTLEEAQRRVMVVDESRVCGYFKDFFIQQANGEECLLASFSLAGPYGSNPATRDLIVSALSGVGAHRHLKYRGFSERDGQTFHAIVTWDFVLERQQ